METFCRAGPSKSGQGVRRRRGGLRRVWQGEVARAVVERFAARIGGLGVGFRGSGARPWPLSSVVAGARRSPAHRAARAARRGRCGTPAPREGGRTGCAAVRPPAGPARRAHSPRARARPGPRAPESWKFRWQFNGLGTILRWPCLAERVESKPYEHTVLWLCKGNR